MSEPSDGFQIFIHAKAGRGDKDTPTEPKRATELQSVHASLCGVAKDIIYCFGTKTELQMFSFSLQSSFDESLINLLKHCDTQKREHKIVLEMGWA